MLPVTTGDAERGLQIRLVSATDECERVQISGSIPNCSSGF
jgi:hypothetical protein